VAFAFEPNACIGHHRVNIGGTVIVTATGCEELCHIPTEAVDSRIRCDRKTEFSARRIVCR
jgi:hypothetical protein